MTSSVPALQRFTTQYSEVEDRIRITGEAGPDQQVALWLTARLLNRVVPALAQWLEKQGSTELRGEILQSMAQQSARAALTPQPPVQSRGDTRSWLAVAVDMTPGEQGLTLVFRSEPQDGTVQNAALVLPARQLRQWLNIVHDQYRKAEWPLNAWPAWIRDAQQNKATPPLEVVLH